MKGYTIDFVNRTITMNYKFAAAAGKYGTAEYKMLRNIQADYPDFTKTVKAGRNVTKPNYNKRLTYKNMEIYISTFENAKELTEYFKTVKKKSKVLAYPYKYVLDWFKQQFPKYREITLFAENTDEKKPNISIVEAPNQKDYEQKKNAS